MSHPDPREPLWSHFLAAGYFVFLIVAIWSDAPHVEATCFLLMGIVGMLVAVVGPVPRGPEPVRDVVDLLPDIVWRTLLAVASLVPIGLGLWGFFGAPA